MVGHLRPRLPVPDALCTDALRFSCPARAGGSGGTQPAPPAIDLVQAACRRCAAFRAAALALFLCVSLGQWGYWAATRGYRTRDVSRELAQIVPPGVTLAGDWAPGLCLNNRVRAVPVLPDLANGRDPLTRLAAWLCAGRTDAVPGAVLEARCAVPGAPGKYRGPVPGA